MIYYICGFILFLCGMLMFFVLAILLGRFALLFVLPISVLLGYVVGTLFKLERKK